MNIYIYSFFYNFFFASLLYMKRKCLLCGVNLVHLCSSRWLFFVCKLYGLIMCKFMYIFYV